MKRQAIPQRLALDLFLAMIAGGAPDGCLLEIRSKSRKPDRDFDQKWLPVLARDALAHHIFDLGRVADTYLGVLPRVREGGTADDVERAHVAWVDCDTPDAVRALADFRPGPSIVIRSGGITDGLPHVHAYWQLKRPLEPEESRALNRALATHLGSDPKVADPARIMRPPGTLSHKHGGRPVVCTVCRPTVHDPDRLARAATPGSRDHRVETLRFPGARLSDDPLRRIPASEYIPAISGREIGPGGKVTCPFHGGGQERTPSLQVYGEGWACFACPPLRPDRDHLGGDIYTFAALYYGLAAVPRGGEFHELRRRIVSDLGMAVAA